MNKEKFLWTVTINDSTAEYRFEILGTGDASIYDVSQVVAKFLRGKIVKQEPPDEG